MVSREDLVDKFKKALDKHLEARASEGHALSTDITWLDGMNFSESGMYRALQEAYAQEGVSFTVRSAGHTSNLYNLYFDVLPKK